MCRIAKNINAWKKNALIQGPTTNVWNCVWNYLKFCITATSPTSPLGWTKAAVLVAIRRRSYDMFKMHTNWCISIRTGKAMYIRFALILSNGHFQIVALVCNIKILFCILSRVSHLRMSQSEEVTLGCQINEYSISKVFILLTHLLGTIFWNSTNS